MLLPNTVFIKEEKLKPQFQDLGLTPSRFTSLLSSAAKNADMSCRILGFCSTHVCSLRNRAAWFLEHSYSAELQNGIFILLGKTV